MAPWLAAERAGRVRLRSCHASDSLEWAVRALSGAPVTVLTQIWIARSTSATRR
jgi:hypothetical protein